MPPHKSPTGPAPRWWRWWSLDLNQASHTERLLSVAGGLLAIYLLFLLSSALLDPSSSTLMVASMGASAVLLFAVPHGALSQPWPLIGGHLISAAIGVSCAQWIGDPGLAAALAVGLAIGAMYYLHCLHPPGGATALVAVIGGEGIHQLGYGFILTPVLGNVAVLLAVALLFNWPFPWRRYPAVWASPPFPAEETEAIQEELGELLLELDSFVDVSREDLLRIYRHARQHAPQPLPCELSGQCCKEGDERCVHQRLSRPLT